MPRTALYLLLATALVSSPLVKAAVIYNVSITTSPLVDHSAGPFSIEAQFNDGSGTSDGNNVAVLSMFDFGAGSSSGVPVSVGGVSGNLSSSVILTDSGFFNQFTQSFNPGGTLSFQLSLTTNIDSGEVPDEFSLAILDISGFEIPTVNAANALIIIDINSIMPTVSTFATDTSQNPNAGGPPITIAEPTVTPVTSSVPEPTTAWLFGTGIGIAAFWRRKQWFRKISYITSKSDTRKLRQGMQTALHSDTTLSKPL